MQEALRGKYNGLTSNYPNIIMRLNAAFHLQIDYSEAR